MSAEYARLCALLAKCSPDEIAVFLFLAERVDVKRSEHGPLDLAADKRDWSKEEREEHADAIMYRAFAAVAELRRAR